MKDVKLKLEYMATEDLTPYKNNAKIHTPEQIEQIMASIRDFGMNDPIGIVGSDNLIVEGHGRLLACERLGIKEVPVIRLDHLSEEERKAYTLAHNKLTMNTGFDMDKLNAELQELVNMDMADYGFIEVDETPVELEEDDYDPDEETFPEPKAKLGDIYKLGEHRLMCGDSTSAEDVAKLMGDQKVDLLLTDPPYNVNYGARGKKYKEKAAEGTVYTAGMDDRTQTTALEEKPLDLENMSREDAIKLIKKIIRESGETSVLRENKPQNSELHPTMKPIALFGRLIQNSTKKGENVLDLFGGSGTTIVACEELGRKGYAMELDPHYVDVIIERWESLTGQKAEKVEE